MRHAFGARGASGARGARVAHGALAVGSLLAAVLAVEVVLRPFRPELSSEWMLGARGRVVDPHTIVITPRLLEPATYAVDPDLPTLVALGDSFTEGHPFKHDASYPAQLDRMLRAAGRPMNVLGIGQGDTGPDQQLRLFEHYVLPRVRPDIVVWQLYSNDLADNVNKAVYAIEGGALAELDARRSWMYRRQRLFDAIPLPVAVKARSRLVQHAMRATERGVGAELPPRFRDRPRPWALEKVRLALEEMHRLGRERGFRVYVALVVPQFLYLDAAREGFPGGMYYGRWRRDFGSLYELGSSYPGFLLLHLRGAAEDARWRALFEDGTRDANPLGSRHYSKTGYRWMAARIATHVLAAPLRAGAPSGHNAVTRAGDVAGAAPREPEP